MRIELQERARNRRSRLRPARIGMAVAGLLLAGVTAPLGAQVAWDAPLMVAPDSPEGWGLYLMDPSPRGAIGVLTTWRGEGRAGYRIGVAEDLEEEVAFFGGVDFSDLLVVASDEFPVDIDWVAGVGFGHGDTTLLSLPLGVSAGRAMELEDVWVNPYVTPRVALDAFVGQNPPGERVSLNMSVDMGVDVAFDPGWTVRFAGSLGNRRAIAIGLSFRLR